MDGIQPLSLLDIDIRSHEAFRELVAYWHEIRGDDSIPARADFNPLKIPALLPEISMLEYTEDRKDIVFRLVAAGLRERSNDDFTGHSLFDQIADEFRTPILTLMQTITQVGCGAYGALDLIYDEGFTARVDTLLLPLTDAAGHATIFLCLFFLPDKDAFRNAPETTKILYKPVDMLLVDIRDENT